MVVRRRGTLMGLVAGAALVVAAGYLWRFGADGGVVPFLVGSALVVVAVLHAVAWRESTSPLLVADLTGLRLRLGGEWAGVSWGEVETVEVAPRGRIGDGRVVVRPRNELRVLAELGRRARLAVVLNRWLYDAPLVVPYGVTTAVSSDDVLGSLERLADGRAPVVEQDDRVTEPEPTVEVAQVGTLRRAEAPAEETTGADETTGALEPPAVLEAPGAPEADRPSHGLHPLPRRLSTVVSALRSSVGRGSESTVPINQPPLTVGTLALSDSLDAQTEPLPELAELRRRAPEDEPSARTANVELIIDATTDLSAQAMQRVRRRPDTAGEAVGDPAEPVSAAPTLVTGPGAPPPEVIGNEIREAREWLGMSVDDLAERTRIRPYVIESIELGDFSPCGGDFYARGHLRMLAGVLGIDPDPLVATYDEHVASAPVSPRAVFDAELTTGVLRPTGGAGSRWGGLVGAVLVLLLVWGLARFFLDDQAPGSDSLRTPAHSSTGLGSPGVGNTLLVPPPTSATAVTLEVPAGQSRVVVWDKDQDVVYQGVLRAGDAKTVQGDGPLRVMAVDGGAVTLATKGHPAAPMGEAGQRVFRHVG